MKALVLGSGGARIAYHVGVVQCLLGEGCHFDIYAGNSAGAIVAATLAQYPSGEEAAASKALDFICNLRTSDVWQPWRPFGRLSGLWKNGMVDAAPLSHSIQKHLQQTKIEMSGKKLRVSAVSLSTGYATTFTENSPFIPLAVAASAAVPGIFEPVQMDEQLWCDGAVRDVAPVNAAIQAGATDITVVCLTPETQEYKGSASNAFTALFRAADIALAEVLEGDLLGARLYTELACAGLSKKKPVKITVIRPESDLLAPGQDALVFDPKCASGMRQRGYEDALVASGRVRSK